MSNNQNTHTADIILGVCIVKLRPDLFIKMLSLSRDSLQKHELTVQYFKSSIILNRSVNQLCSNLLYMIMQC